MKFSGLVALVSAFSATVLAVPVNGAEDIQLRAADAAFAGLSWSQSQIVSDVIAEARKEEPAKKRCETALTTVITETTLRMLANDAVPDSLKFKNDGKGADNDSVGLYQQRFMFYKNLACDMDTQCSTNQFFTVMKGIPNWQTTAVPQLCQQIQRSERPDAYAGHYAQAQQLCATAFP